MKSYVFLLICGALLHETAFCMKKHVRQPTISEEDIEAMLKDMRITDDPEEKLETMDDEEAWCREQAKMHYDRMRQVERYRRRLARENGMKRVPGCLDIKALVKEAKDAEKAGKTLTHKGTGSNNE